MNTITLVDSNKDHEMTDKPGAQLALIREKKGFTPEYVASKLHLRVQLLGLLESDNYEQLPQPVFVKGYIRAYANFLGLSPEPFISSFNSFCTEDRKMERTLWQSKRTSNTHERLVRWVTGGIVVIAVIAMTVWWQQNSSLTKPITAQFKSNENAQNTPQTTETYLTQVSKIQSLFKPADSAESVSETHGG